MSLIKKCPSNQNHIAAPNILCSKATFKKVCPSIVGFSSNMNYSIQILSLLVEAKKNVQQGERLIADVPATLK